MGVKKVNIPAPRAREEIPDSVNGNQLDLGAPQAAQPPAAPRAKRYGGRTVAKSVTIESDLYDDVMEIGADMGLNLSRIIGLALRDFVRKYGQP